MVRQPPNIVDGMRAARDRAARRVEVFRLECERAEADAAFWGRLATKLRDAEASDARRRANERWQALRSQLATAKADLADWEQRVNNAVRRRRKRGWDC